MRRFVFSAVVAAVIAASSHVVSADVRSEQRVTFQLGGALGKLVNMFGGRGARDGVTTTVALKGDRKATMSENNGQIVDLAEEKVYDLDLRRRTYRVTTFAELRAQMEKARRDAEQSAARETARERDEPAPDPDAKQYEIDFDVKNTGATRSINGFDTRQTVITITVREQGKTLQDGGGLVVTSDAWLAPSAPSAKELADFDLRYAQALFGPTVAGASAQDLAMAMAMYPMIKPALDRLRDEGTKSEGTAILTTITMEAMQPAGGAGEPAPAEASAPRPRGLGGMLGGLAKKAARRDEPAKGGKATVLTTSVELLKLTTEVSADAVAIPAGFKETQ